MSYDLYFTLAFLGIIGFAMLIGFLRGFRNSLYGFIVKLAFFAIFFLTLNLVVNQLWTMNLPGISDVVAIVVPGAGAVNSLSEALPLVLAELLGDSIGAAATNEELIAFVSGLGIFIVKIVYTIVYFTAIYLIWRILFFIVKLIIFSKSEKTMTTRAMGAGVGALNGLLSVFVMLIVFGGIMSIAESFSTLIDDTGVTAEYVEFETVSEGTSQPAVGNLDESVEMLADIVKGFNENLFVKAFNAITITSDSGESRAAHIYLFDSVFSFEYRDSEISFRKEIGIIAEIAGIVYNSEYMEENNLSKIKPDEIRRVFDTLSHSNLFTAILPLGIELGAAYSDIDLEAILEENDVDLYALDWSQEVEQLGAVMYVLADIVHTAGLVDDDTELETVTFSPELVKDFFDEMSESELITISAYVAINPLLEQAGADAQAIITVPEGMEWKDEFKAIGGIASEIVRTNVTIGDFQAGDPMNLLNIMTTFDFVVMLESQLLSHAMVNVLEGRAEIEGLEMIVVPMGMDWFDKEDGELLKIFTAFNEIAKIASEINYEDEFDLNFIQELSVDAINILIASEVLESTIGNLIFDELGDELTIPLSAQKQITTINGDILQIVLGTEISKVFDALKVFAIADYNNIEFGMSLLHSLAIDQDENRHILDESKAAKLFGPDASEIIHATLSSMMFDLMDDTEGNDVLVVPYKNAQDEAIQYILDDIRYIESDEIINVLRAVLLLGLDDFEDIESLDIDRLIEHSDTILQAAILHATVSKQLFDYMDNGETDSFIVVPTYKATENGNGPEPIRLKVGVGEVFDWNAESMEFTYIEAEEITALLDALKHLELTDFDAIGAGFELDLSLLVEDEGDITPILDSAIIHASVSNQIINLDQSDDPNGTLIVPYYKAPENGDPAELIRIKVGSGDELTTYIIKTEIQAVINALDLLLDEGSIDDFDADFDLSLLVEEDDNITSVLSSAIIHASISKQIFNLDESDNPEGTIIVPYYKAPENGDPAEAIRMSVGFEETDADNDNASMQTDYITKQEIQALINAFDYIMEGKGIDEFDTNFDLSLLVEEEGEITSILSSAVIHATVSRQIFNLDQSDELDGTLIVPYYKAPENGNPAELIRIKAGSGDELTTYILKTEIQAVINALDLLLDEGGIDDFDADFDLSLLVEEDNNITSVLNSAIIHASISRQVLNLDESDDPEGTIIVPYYKLLSDSTTEAIRIVVGFGETDSDNNDAPMDTPFITKAEIQALINAFDYIMEGKGIDEFDANFDLGLLVEDEGETTSVLNSAIIHATISRQLLNLDESDDPNGMIVIPYYSALEEAIRVRVGYSETDSYGDSKEMVFITKAEIQAAINAFDIIIEGSFSDFNGDISLSTIYAPDDDPLLNVDERDTLLKSAIIHATFSKQIINLDDWDHTLQLSTTASVIVPYYAQPVNGNPAVQIRVLIKAGEVDPDTSESVETNYIIKDEIRNIIHALHIIMDGEEDDNLTSFTGAVDLSKLLEDNNAEEVLQSAIVQATVSNQVLKIEADGNVIVPYLSGDLTEKQIRFSVDYATVNFEFVDRDELVNLIKALNVLGDDDIEQFGGSISLSLIYDPEPALGDPVDERDTMLTSAIIHATLSDQLFGVETDGNLTIPTTIQRKIGEVDEYVENIRIDTDASGNINNYITQIEIKRLIEVIHLFGIDDVSNFDGEFNLSVLEGEAEQNTLLASAAMHATISQTLYDLDTDEAIVLPFISQHGLRTVRYDFDSVDYVSDYEIRKLIDAFIVMEYTDLSSFGTNPLDSTKFFDEREVLLLSDVIHATLSKEMLDASQAGNLIIRDYYDDDGDLNDVTNMIRIVTTGDIIYVDRNEVDGVMTALEILGLTDFTNIVITPGVIFAEDVDFAELINSSVTIQATISKTFLEDVNALDDDALDPNVASSAQIIVPNYFRENILITLYDNILEDYQQETRSQIEKDELISMLTGIQILVNADETYSDFGDDFNAEAITTLDESDIALMLESASIHVTIHNMLRGNTNIDIPQRATDGWPANTTLYAIEDYDIITVLEVQKFIKSVFTLGETSFTDANFDFATIAALDQADRDIILDSMIVQNTLTPAVENAILAYQASIFPNTYTVPNTYYYDDDPNTFFTGIGIDNVIKDIDQGVTD